MLHFYTSVHVIGAAFSASKCCNLPLNRRELTKAPSFWQERPLEFKQFNKRLFGGRTRWSIDFPYRSIFRVAGSLLSTNRERGTRIFHKSAANLQNMGLVDGGAWKSKYSIGVLELVIHSYSERVLFYAREEMLLNTVSGSIFFGRI